MSHERKEVAHFLGLPEHRFAEQGYEIEDGSQSFPCNDCGVMTSFAPKSLAQMEEHRELGPILILCGFCGVERMAAEIMDGQPIESEIIGESSPEIEELMQNPIKLIALSRAVRRMERS